MGRLADRLGPRPFLTAGPLTISAGFLLLLRLGTSVSLGADLLPALVVLSLGLALTVSPLTATVLSDADEGDAGIASAVNNAIARTASLIAVAGIGALVAAHYSDGLDRRIANRLPASSASAVTAAKRRTFAKIDPAAVPPALRPAAERASLDASRDAFHLAAGVGAGLLAIAGLGGLALGGRPRTAVRARDCAGGQLAGAPVAAAVEQRATAPLAAPAGSGAGVA